MDSWPLQGDSYSFLRSAPHTFSLCHRDGTPNHVEIFDIINVPSQRSAISETTCLCDIFGDDCESPSLSSSPAIGPFVISQREVDGTAAASSLADELNDSSGSYHSAQGFSEGEEGFEDSRERLYSPQLQSEPSERRQPGGERQSSGHPEVTEDSNTNLEPLGKSPVPQLSTASPSIEVLNTAERTPSPGHNSPDTLNPEGRVSLLSSSLVEKECSPSPPNPGQEAEPRRITPTFKDRHSPSHQSLTPSHSPDPRNCVSSSSSQSANLQSLTELRIVQVSSEPRSSCFNQHNSPLPECTTKDFSLESAFESRAILSDPLPSPSSTELSYQSRETLVSPELKNRPYSPDTQASSPFPDLGRRVSLPDLFSRSFTPDIEDSTHNPELISDLSVTTTTPKSQGTRLSVEPVSTVSTPGPRYTPPSPVISIATSPELLERSASPELSYRAPSPGLLSAASPAKTGTRTPSPSTSHKIRHISTPSEIESQVSSPVVSHSLSPSPEVTSNCSPIEHRYSSPSPEIRITASSPEVSRREGSSEVQTTSASPLLEPHFDSASQRSLTSSPHITGISYSVVQPEDRDISPFPELSCLSTSEPGNTLVFSETKSPTPSRDSPTGTPQDSPHILSFTSSVVQPEITHQPRYQTPSPHPSHYTPSPEPRYQSPSADKYQSPSPQYRSKTPSPVAPSPEQSYSKHSPANLSTEYNPEYSPLRNKLEFEGASSSVDIIETQYPTHLAKVSVSPSFELDKDNATAASEIKSRPPVVAVPSSVFISPLAEEKVQSSLKKERAEREATPQKVNIQDNSSVASFSEEKQVIGPTLIQKEDIYNNLPTEIKCAFPYIVSEDRSPSLYIQAAPSKSSVHRLESPLHQVTSYSPISENSGSLKSACKREHTQRQLSTSDRRENSERLTEDMAHHVNRRRTPSPPLTRFTPVHIIAPEKPYRHWQKSSRRPSQVVASSMSGNLKKAVTNRESPSVAPVDNNSQAHWVRLGMQLEMEREMQLEEDREVGRERLMDREREREEQLLEKGKGWQGDTSYRGEQVELSFNARNRKGPASRRAARTSRETCKGLSTVHSYSESLLATRPLQQQQSLLRLASQQDIGGGGSGRRLQPPAHQNKISTAGRVAINRPRQSSSSSMGSELDEADNEVKWFTDLAFRSLSSPEVDYLDMYNSSHRSSTNISQPSTQESPAGVSAAWMAYADFRGSAPKLDNDELSFQKPSVYYSDGLDPSRRFELGSFECIDVAVEKEDSRKVRRGVPKRQIQLKRKDNFEGKQDESSQNSSPSVLMMMESPSVESPSGGTLVRQHSTPAAIQECFTTEHSPEPNQQNERKSKLQKSVSLDEACTKTKIATCLIKSVLSKKMQSVDKRPDEQAGDVSPAFEENSAPTENAVAPLRESSKPEAHNLNSSLQSDYSLSSEGPGGGPGEPNANDEAKPLKSYGGRSSNRPSSSSSSRSVNFSQTESEEADSQSRQKNSLRSEMRSELKVPFDSKQSRNGVQHADDIKPRSGREGGDSANATTGNTGAPSATGASSSQTRATNRNQECENTEDHKQLQQGDKSPHTPKREEISLISLAMEKKKASLNVCLTPEAENKREPSSPDMSYREREGRVETIVNEKTAEEEGNGNNQVKAPLHKVRDVRRLVKNTYNLSFKAASAVMTSNVNKEMVGNFNEGKREEMTEERRGEVKTWEEREVRQEKRREERREEKEEELRVKMKEDQKEEVKESKLPTLSPPLQTKGNPPSRPQPMQIEYKAVCWKEDKNKCSMRDSNANTLNYTTVDTATVKSCCHDLKMTAGTQESTTEMHKVPDNEDKLVGERTDRKPPMLGSLPKLPSKDREVSTAVVLIRDGSSKAKTSAAAAQEKIPIPVQAPAASHSPGPTTPSSSGHSVSMLLKEKGYQADIGAVVGDNQNGAGGKRFSCKHVNCLEIPLQTTAPSDMGHIQCHRERTFSSSSNMSDNTDSLTKSSEDEEVANKPTVRDTAKQKSTSLLRNTLEQTAPPTKQKQLGDFEALKRLDPTFPPRSPSIRRFRPQPIEVKSVSKEIQKQEKPTNSTANNKPQTIEVKSIAKNSQKPAVPPKPNCKFKPADLAAMPNEAQRPSATTSSVKPQGEDRPQTIVVSSPTIYRKISNELTSVSNYTRKLSVSAVSSLKPPPCKATETAITTLSNQSAAPSKMDACHDRGQQQKSGATSQNSSNTQRPTTLATTTTTAHGTGLTSGPVSDTEATQVTDPASAGTIQPCQPTVRDVDSQLKYPRIANPHEHIMPVSSNNAKQPAAFTTQVPGYTHQPCHRSFSEEHRQRTDDLRFYASDDPPSYDERESFSPLMLPDLTPRKSNRYQPSSRPPPCSCTAGCPSHPGLIHPQRHLSPQNLTPPAPPHSPGQGLPYPLVQPPLCPHQCRSDPQQISYQPVSPKSSPIGPSQPPAMYQPLHQPPPHPSVIQASPADRPLQPPQHIDSRRPPVHRSPQQQPPGMSGAPYCDPGHSHSPGLPPMDPHYLCGPQSLGPSYGSEYGGDSSSLYSESSYGQTPRRVLLDPETGKYFYIEVPVQPLRKMLFDPETGQYVEVLIPQQAMSHSGLYPPSAAPYPPLHNPNMYAPAPQYMPYAAPPPPAHPQTQPQPPRYPEASAAATMHHSGPGVSYRNSSGQASKPEPQNHPPLDQSYLESMYYVPTGMTASPNPTPPDYYPKNSPNLPPSGGKRS